MVVNGRPWMRSYSSRPMFFVTGASRSGTTVLAGMLRKHSEIAGLKEMHYFGHCWDPRNGPRLLCRDAQRSYAARLLKRQELWILEAGSGREDSAEVEELLQRLPEQCDAAELFACAVDYLAERAGKRVPCEHTPRNIYYARELLDVYSDARVVHLVRDPRAVVASQKHRWRRRSLMDDPVRMSRRQQLRTWANYHPYTASRLWSVATERALELSEHPRFFMLRFEDLIAAPGPRMCEVCRFLGIEFRPEMLEIEHLNSSYVSSRNGGRGLSRVAVDAWRTRLKPGERVLVEQRCAALMHRLGYLPQAPDVANPPRVRFALGYLAHLAAAAVVNPRRLWIQGRAVLRRSGGWPRAPGDPGSGRRRRSGLGAEAPPGDAERAWR